MSLPEVLCEWCGQPTKYVRVLNAEQTIPIDPEPQPLTDYRAKYVRVPPRLAAGRIDVVVKIEGATWRYQNCYLHHKETCEHADKWTGKRKWKVPNPRTELRESPELDTALARNG